jgi:hypothetical protein
MKNQIVEELRHVEALKLSMKRTLAKLVRWEKRLRRSATNPGKPATGGHAVAEKVQRRPKPGLTPVERVNKALESISGTFTRAELLVEAQRYGEGAIGVGSFRRIFNDLKRTQGIHCVEGRPKDRDSRWLRSEE